MDEVLEAFHAAVRTAANATRGADKTSAPEQVFRRGVEAALSSIFTTWGVTFAPSMERATVTKRRIDMLCGRVVMEYKAPGVLENVAAFSAAQEQARDYLEQLATEFAEPLSEYYGIVLDGDYVGFVHHDAQRGWMHSERFRWDLDGALAVLERFRGHSKHPLDAATIARALGPDSASAKLLLPALVATLDSPTGKTALLFSEWRRLFGQAVGTEAHQYPGIVDWAAKLGIKVNGEDREQLSRLFFSIHTYYALVIKLITAEVIETVRSRSLSPYAQRLHAATPADRIKLLRELEGNAIFERAGISNFLEGDFFAWYLDHADDPQLDAAIAVLAEAVSRFEPATPLLSPSRVTDLYKKLYQNLVPDRIRHDLGEFYTPDWLADYVLERSGFAASPRGRLLDPACGSGTFLVRAINKLKADETLRPTELLDHVRQQHIVGFDLNPLAVVAARANIILAILDDLRESTTPLAIPVYLADSIYSPEVENDKYVYRLQTERGVVQMEFPAALVSGPDFQPLLREVERLMWEDSDKPAAEDLPLDSLVVKHGLVEFYRQIWELDEQDWNKIWCRIISNRFAAVAVGSFDFIVGNPPWVVWSNLPSSYRESVKHVCDRYNIFSDDGWVGGIESDISTVMTLCAADRWLRDGGRLGFVITQSVFKTKSAQGFRRFRLPGGESLEVFHVDDMTTLRPFDDAANRTATLFLRKGSPTVYPVPYLVWRRQSRRHAISSEAPLAHILRQVHIWAQEGCPVSSDGGAWITAPSGHSATLLALLGGPGLHARKGTTTDFNNIYWLRVLSANGDQLLVENNLSDQGHQVRRSQSWVERELVYPLARGQDIGRFSVRPPEIGILVPQTGMRAHDENTMSERYPRALAYFQQFKDGACCGCRVGSTCRRGLVQRGSYANPKYRSAIGEYWGIWNVGAYTFAPYKVAWKEVSSKFEAAVLSTASLEGVGERLHVPDHKLMFKPCQTEGEAHYLCGVLNSSMIRGFAEAVSLSTSRGTRIFEELNVPAFDPAVPAHALVATLSKAVHDGTREISEQFEAELDIAVSEAIGAVRAPQQLQAQLAVDSLTQSVRERIVSHPAVQFPRAHEVLTELQFVALDVETTGFAPDSLGDRIVEVGAVKFKLGGGLGETWHRLVWPGRPISPRATAVHGIAWNQITNEPTFADVWTSLQAFIGQAIVVAHNASFDAAFLGAQLGDIGLFEPYLFLDTLQLLRAQFSLPSNRLSDAIAALGVEGEVMHTALGDAVATAQLMLRIYELLRGRASLNTLGDLAAISGGPPLSVARVERSDQFTSLARAGASVSVRYRRAGGDSQIIGGRVECSVAVPSASHSYVTLRTSGGRRLLLRSDRIEDVQPAERAKRS